MKQPVRGGLIGLGAAAGAICVALAGSPAPAQPAPPDYHPSLGDLMTMAVQPRHIKLGLAGRARNWTYLAYEAGEQPGAECLHRSP